MSTRITTLVAGAAVIGAAVVCGGTANASAKDDQFLQLLTQAGLDITNPSSVIEGAHDFCDALEQGATPNQIMQQLVDTGKFNRTDAKNIVSTAVTVYCPDEAS